MHWTATPLTSSNRWTGPRRETGRTIDRAGTGRTGAVRWQKALPSARVAAPAARGGLIAIPVESQSCCSTTGATGAPLGSGLVDRGGRHLRARAARGAVVRLARRVPDGAGHRARLAPRTGLLVGAPAGVRPSDLRLRLLPSRADRVLGDRSQPRALARDAWTAVARSSETGWRSCTITGSSSPSTPASGALRWAYVSPDRRGRLDGHRQGRSCTPPSTGEMAALDPLTGARDLPGRRLPGEVVRGASFDAEGFTPARRPRRRPARRRI